MHTLNYIPTFEDIAQERDAQNYEYPSSDQALHEIADLLQRYPDLYFQNKESVDFDIPGHVFSSLGGGYAISLYEKQNHDELKDIMNYMEKKWIEEKKRKTISGETSESEMDYFVQFCFLESIFYAILRNPDTYKGIFSFFPPQLAQRYKELSASWNQP